MNLICPIIIACIYFLTGLNLAEAQTLYKCGSTYSQMPCSAEAEKINIKQKTSPQKSARQLLDKAPLETRIKSEKLCKNAIQAKLKDPESARFNEIARNGVFERPVPPPDGALQIGASYSGWVNAKNSYGGYTGDRLFFCYLNEQETTVTYVSILEK